MTHQDSIGLLECLPESGIRDQAIARLERYHALLNVSVGYLETPAATWDDADALLRAILEAIK